MNQESPQPGSSKRQPPMVAVGLMAALVLIAGGIFLWQWMHPAPSVEPVVAQSSALPDNRIRRFSDGVRIDPTEQPKRWYAVMVENSAEAWPLSGLSQARLVIEAPVEGSIPRFMALFDDAQNVDKIGPVRSARPYYIDWAIGMNAMYAHVGGSPDALSKINTLSVQDLNQFFWDPYFWRSTDRYAPHNVYTSVKLLSEGFLKRGYEDSGALPKLGWLYSDAVASAGTSVEPATSVTFPFSPVSQSYDAVWKYDAQRQSYARYQNDEQQADQDGTTVYASNVVVLKMPVSVIDDVGRREIGTIGQGKGSLFRDGQQISVTWKKESRQAILELFTGDGKTAELRAGPTWIEVIPLSTEVITE